MRVAARLAPRLRTVINLTGTVIHTNLGRALLADSALQHLLAMMAGPNNLEYDLASGGRGDRDTVVEELLCTLTGAEAATVVNNNAAAVLLTIAALARGQEVIVSRGELVEIGGAFRMPDVMASAGATLVEVGTTNRTHPHDYERAINERTALLMKIHTSNYAVQGSPPPWTKPIWPPSRTPGQLPLATDLGSGALVDMAQWGLPREPLPQEKLAAGCDVVSFSGDKLLGGPQAGLIVGSRAAIGRIRKFPMKRALRMSKLPLAALEATLMLYLRPERLTQDLPTLRLLTRPVEAIRAGLAGCKPAVATAVAPRFRWPWWTCWARSARARCRWNACLRPAWPSHRRQKKGVSGALAGRTVHRLAWSCPSPSSAAPYRAAEDRPAAGPALPGRRCKECSRKWA
jgi:L-seryl-tRNA(Ser) seleniumtransferase